MRKILLFGAGKIGRSFIGQLFSKGGYHVVFADIYEPVISTLNKEGKYKLVIKANSGDQTEWIYNVSGVMANDEKAIINEIVDCELMAVSVGQRGLTALLPLIAKGINKRIEENKGAIDIIIAENMRNASEYMYEQLTKNLPSNFDINKNIGLVETSIGKMVPIMKNEDVEHDILQVFAEPYNNLILDKKAFKNPIPKINGLSPKENMKAWVDRKLFIHNLGHAATAYLGYIDNPDLTYIWEVLENHNTRKQIRDTMLQSAHTLQHMYPSEFTMEDLTAHIDDLLQRFENKALGDTIYRVGCDLNRKLSKDDRLAGAIFNSINMRMSYDLILYALVAGFFFRAKDENNKLFPSDEQFIEIFNKGTEHILRNICGFNNTQHAVIFEKADNYFQQIGAKFYN